MPSTPALTAVSSALNTLGYTYSESLASSGSSTSTSSTGLGLDPSTYAVLAPGTAYRNISRTNPEARFILPASSDSPPKSWLGTYFQERVPREDADADSDRAFFLPRWRVGVRVDRDVAHRSFLKSTSSRLVRMHRRRPGLPYVISWASGIAWWGS
jgi:hypothetical protein